MDDQRVGAALRTVRIRRGWTQRELARRGGVSATTVSEIEFGNLDHVSRRAFRRVAAALDVRVSYSVRLPHGELDRLVNSGHAALHEAVARYLNELPDWVHAPEVSFAIYGERGVIDILAFHEPTGSLLVIELKTEFVSLEDLLTTMDVRLRHATTIARERGWRARSVSAWIVFADTDTNCRRVTAHRSVLRAAYSVDGRTLRGWLLHPSEAVRALSFWANFGASGASANDVGRRRVRKRGRGTTTQSESVVAGLGGGSRLPDPD